MKIHQKDGQYYAIQDDIVGTGKTFRQAIAWCLWGLKMKLHRLHMNDKQPSLWKRLHGLFA